MGAMKLCEKEILRRARSIHGDTYEYALETYVAASIPMQMVCRAHGTFKQSLDAHVNQMSGCPKCFGSFRRTTEQFVSDARCSHGDRYDYSRVVYINNRTPVEILCAQHGAFWQKPARHLQTSGECPQCSAHGPAKMIEKWLTAIGVPNTNEHRSVRLADGLIVDGLVNDVAYEFYASYWCGDPNCYKQDETNRKNGRRMGSLYVETLEKQQTIRELGYELKFAWENDYRDGKLFSRKNPHE